MPSPSQGEFHELIKLNLPADQETLLPILKILNDENIIINEVAFSGNGWFNEDGRFCLATNSNKKYKYKIMFNNGRKYLYDILR